MDFRSLNGLRSDVTEFDAKITVAIVAIKV